VLHFSPSALSFSAALRGEEYAISLPHLSRQWSMRGPWPSSAAVSSGFPDGGKRGQDI
jgi:hypothetical protein